MESTNVQTDSKPSVFEYTDYRAYLKAFYEWSKRHSEFSHAVFAKRAGLKSRSYLRLVLTGKRNLSPDAVTKFIEGLDLRPLEAEAFTALVYFTQSADFEARKKYWEEFLSLRPKDQKIHRVRDEYLYLARMAYPTLLILLRQPHVEHDPKALAHLTGMTQPQVEEGIETLINLGVVQRQGENRYFVADGGVATSDDIPNVAIDTFHKNMMKEAQNKTDLPKNQREYQSVMMPLNEEEFLYIRRRLRDLAHEIDQKFAGRRPQSNRVYALNLNLIPLTPEFIRASKEDSSQKAVDVTEPKEKSV
jgi:uncharacterized protein (TIGR02147 family)